MNGNCERCYKPTSITTGSYFNTEMICMPCSRTEELHSDFQKARDAEMAEVKKGNLNFEGIGKPNNL
jgi:hypothetical protein